MFGTPRLEDLQVKLKQLEDRLASARTYMQLVMQHSDKVEQLVKKRAALESELKGTKELHKEHTKALKSTLKRLGSVL